MSTNKNIKFPQAVAFDKDGTLLKYYEFWFPVISGVVKAVVNDCNAPDYLIDEIMKWSGVYNGETDIRGTLVSTTHDSFLKKLLEILSEYGVKVDEERAKAVYYEALKESLPHGEILPICEDMVYSLTRLKERGIKLFLITNDIRVPSEHCLEKLEVLHLFDEVITSEEFKAKPSPDSMKYIIDKYGFEKDRVYMVGDTLTDLQYANNAGVVAVGVGENEKNLRILSPFADLITENVSTLTLTIEKLK